MRNEDAKIKKIISLVENLPCFNLDDLIPIEGDKTYLKIFFLAMKNAEN